MLRVHLRTEDAPAREQHADSYPLRPRSFAFSVLIHAGVLTLVAIGSSPSFVDPEESKSLYQIAIAPNRNKIIWYRLKDTLPPVSPANQQPEGDTARGRIQSFQQPIVAKPPNAPPGRQLIWQPAPKLRLEEELKSPNLIALRAPSFPAPPAPTVVKRKPKVFVPPAVKPGSQQNSTLSTPVIDVGAPQLNAAAPGLALAPKPKARVFAAPVRQEAKISVPKLIDSAPDAGVSIGSASIGAGSQSVVEQGVMSALRVKPKARAFQAPSSGAGAGRSPGDGSGALIEAGTDAQLSAAVIGLNPADGLAGPLPNGVLSAEFSRAPIPGEPVMGGSGNGVKIPNVMVGGGGKSAAAPPIGAPGSSKPVYVETILPTPSATLAVPLRPSSRIIPASIEARFGQRAVYTIVIPVKLPLYSGDWILWFAEREPQPGTTPQIRSPFPAKKLESLTGPLPAISSQEESRVQIAAIIRKDGQVEGIKIVSGREVGLYQRAIEDLQNWQFHPALHNGVPMDVDIVVEIPFRLTTPVAGR